MVCTHGKIYQCRVAWQYPSISGADNLSATSASLGRYVTHILTHHFGIEMEERAVVYFLVSEEQEQVFVIAESLFQSLVKKQTVAFEHLFLTIFYLNGNTVQGGEERGGSSCYSFQFGIIRIRGCVLFDIEYVMETALFRRGKPTELATDRISKHVIDAKSGRMVTIDRVTHEA